MSGLSTAINIFIFILWILVIYSAWEGQINYATYYLVMAFYLDWLLFEYYKKQNNSS